MLAFVRSIPLRIRWLEVYREREMVEAELAICTTAVGQSDQRVDRWLTVFRRGIDPTISYKRALKRRDRSWTSYKLAVEITDNIACEHARLVTCIADYDKQLRRIESEIDSIYAQ